MEKNVAPMRQNGVGPRVQVAGVGLQIPDVVVMRALESLHVW